MKPPRTSRSPATRRRPVVLVTGASQGIGAAIAESFAREFPGVRLALVARSEKNLQRTASKCRQLGATTAVFPCDVTDAAAVEGLGHAVTARFGGVEVLINNAGGFVPKPLLETSAEDFDTMVAVNLRSAFLVARAFVPAMVGRGRGDVFFMGSIAGLQAYPRSAAYCAAKFGVRGLALALRAETKGTGVRVCCVHPGATWSPSWSGAGVKPSRIMPAEDVAEAFLAAYRMTRRTVVEEIVLRPEQGDI